MSNDFLDQMGDGKKRSSRKQRLDNPVRDRVHEQQVKTAVADKNDTIPKSMKAGEYIRQTITILQGQRELIKKLASENRVSLLSFYRWLLDQGLQAYEAGERPLPSDPVYSDVEMGHWSSRGK